MTSLCHLATLSITCDLIHHQTIINKCIHQMKIIIIKLYASISPAFVCFFFLSFFFIYIFIRIYLVNLLCVFRVNCQPFSFRFNNNNKNNWCAFTFAINIQRDREQNIAVLRIFLLFQCRSSVLFLIFIRS